MARRRWEVASLRLHDNNAVIYISLPSLLWFCSVTLILSEASYSSWFAELAQITIFHNVHMSYWMVLWITLSLSLKFQPSAVNRSLSEISPTLPLRNWHGTFYVHLTVTQLWCAKEWARSDCGVKSDMPCLNGGLVYRCLCFCSKHCVFCPVVLKYRFQVKTTKYALDRRTTLALVQHGKA